MVYFCTRHFLAETYGKQYGRGMASETLCDSQDSSDSSTSLPCTLSLSILELLQELVTHVTLLCTEKDSCLNNSRSINKADKTNCIFPIIIRKQ